MTTTIEYILLYVIVFEIFVKILNREKINWISNGIFDLVPSSNSSRDIF